MGPEVSVTVKVSIKDADRPGEVLTRVVDVQLSEMGFCVPTHGYSGLRGAARSLTLVLLQTRPSALQIFLSEGIRGTAEGRVWKLLFR